MKLHGLLRAGLILVLGSGSVFAAEFGLGDLFGQAGSYTQLGQESGTWGMFGGGAGVHVGGQASIFGEFNYAHPTVPAALNAGSVWGTGNLVEAGGGFRFFIPARSHTVRPYVPAVAGWLHASTTAEVLFPVMISYPLALIPLPISGSGGYIGTGLGAELGITPRFGLRPEFRILGEFFGSGSAGIPRVSEDAMIFSVGAYYRFGKL